ncbi:MAG: hypothetical protein ABMB14_40210, partial [Myxococcota bacterium]
MPVDHRILNLEHAVRSGDSVHALAVARGVRVDVGDGLALATWAAVCEASAAADAEDLREARAAAERAAIEARRHGDRSLAGVAARVLGRGVLAGGARARARLRGAEA